MSIITKLRRRSLLGTCTLAAALGGILVSSMPALGQVLFSEDFESLTYGVPVDENLNDNVVDEAYSPTGPEGWSVDRTAVPAGGVLEFSGWNFLSPSWWDAVAGQERGTFSTTSEGVVAVADGDEWDDAGPEGNMTTFLTTPGIPVSPGDVDMTFDTSWRPDGTQEATVRAIFDAGDPVELLHWYSSEDAGGPLSGDGLFGFRTDPIADGVPADEIVDATIPVPAGASSVSLEFGYVNAGNNWWWAVDNIAVGDNYFEDFEGVELGPNLDEDRLPEALRVDDPPVWTNQAPEGWVIDNSGVPGADDPDNDGVTEWAGWSFANKDFWIQVAGDQSRSNFSAGEGGLLIADPDEWDDAGHPNSEENGWFQTTIDTPAISLEGVEDGDEVTVQFDSSWRPEFDSNFRQSGRLVATFSDGSEAEIFEWRSARNADDTAHVTEEFLAGSDVVANIYGDLDKANDDDLTFPVPVPAGADSVSFQFEMFDAGNDWWWAIDNLQVLSSGGGSTSLPGDVDGNGTVEFADFLILSANFGTMVEAGTNGDLDGNGDVEFADFLVLSANFGNSVAAVASVPEPTGLALCMLGMLLGLTARRRRR